jgi:Flp pilus assembly pilin Flp
MSPETSGKLLENVEHHLGAAVTAVERGLLAAFSAVALLGLAHFRIAPAKVSIPGLEVSLPTPLGSLALLLVSVIFGVAAAYRVWLASTLGDALRAAFEAASDAARDRFVEARIVAQTKRSPLLAPAPMLGVVLCAECLHIWYFMLALSGAGVHRSEHFWPGGFAGLAIMSFGAAGLTCAPFVVLGAVFVHATLTSRL